MDKQQKEQFNEMSERDREIQSSFWSLILLIGEMALAFRILRDRLAGLNILTSEDNEIIDQASMDPNNLTAAYNHIEKAFRTKYDRCKFTMDNPEEVERQVQVIKEKAEKKTATIPGNISNVINLNAPSESTKDKGDS